MCSVLSIFVCYIMSNNMVMTMYKSLYLSSYVACVVTIYLCICYIISNFLIPFKIVFFFFLCVWITWCLGQLTCYFSNFRIVKLMTSKTFIIFWRAGNLHWFTGEYLLYRWKLNWQSQERKYFICSYARNQPIYILEHCRILGCNIRGL